MASRFVLTAQVQLQAPTNTRQVVNQIQQQLRGVNVQVNLQGGQQASRQVNNLNKATKQATTQATKMGKAFGASIRRFGAFTIATRAVSLFTNSLANATKEAIDFEREMVKISQVTGKTMAQLKGLENTITGLATSLGVSSKSILSVGRILSQAGIQAKDLNVALTTLAKTSLAPTFDDITQTAEGAVAILAQFGEGVGALERQLGAINRVAGQFAVEAGDLISVIRRTGGVFKAAGGDLEELIALFTSVRATTRESAESIATGLRTIFTRIQRPATIEFLKQFGVQLTDLNGKFIGPYEAIRQLSGALAGLEQGDIRFIRIAEELGGFRQIGKVIPLLQQFETAERARQAAIEGGNSLNEDAQKAQAALAVQIAKVKEEFLALIRSLTQTSSFNLFVKSSLELASALIKIADALKPLIPLLTAFAAVKFARGAAGFARGIGAGLRGGPTGFARGGMVPGTGNRDTVPAMLTPGEFVIRKSSVGKLGAGTLAAMNENGYAAGGVVTSGRNFYGNILPVGGAKLRPELQKLSGTAPASTAAGTQFVDTKNENRVLTILNRAISKKADVDDFGAAFLRPFGSNVSLKGTTDPATVNEEAQKLTSRLASLGITSGRARGPKPTLGRRIKGIIEGYNNKNKFRLDAGSLKKDQANSLEETLLSGIEKTIIDGAKQLNTKLKVKGAVETASILKSANVDQTLGNLFEGVLSFTGAPYSEKDSDAPNAPFDFAKGLGAFLSGIFGLSRVSKRPTEAKSTFATKNIASISKKVENQNAAEMRREVLEAFLSVAPQLTDFAATDVKKLFGAKSEEALARSVPSAVFSKKGQQSRVAFRNSGGGISGSDTVPAMLTPGEFVFNKSAAQSIGYSNLNRMNKQGVKGFNKGGSVGGVQYFNQGNRVTGQQALAAAKVAQSTPILKGQDQNAAKVFSAIISQLQKTMRQASRETGTTKKELQDFKQALIILDKELEKVEKGTKETTTAEQQRAKQQKQNQAAAKSTGLTRGGPVISGSMFIPASSVNSKASNDTSTAANNAAKSMKNAAQAANANASALNQDTQGLRVSTGIKRKLQTVEVRYKRMLRDLPKTLNNVKKGFVDLSARGVGAAAKGFRSLGAQAAQAGRKLMGMATSAMSMMGGMFAGRRGGGGGGNGGTPARRGDTAGALMAVTMIAGMIPDLEDADSGMRAVANQSKVAALQIGTVIFALQSFGLSLKRQSMANMMGGGVVGIGKALGTFAIVAGVAAFATNALSKVVDSYTGVKIKAKQAEEEAVKNASEANERKAQEAAAAAANADAMNKVATGAAIAGASIGFAFGGPFGAAIGGAIGGLVGFGLKIADANGLLGGFASSVQDFFAGLGLGSTKAQIKAQTSFTIASARAQKILAESAKEAAEELKEIEAGNLSATASLGAGGAAAKAAQAIGKQDAAAKELIRANEAQTQQIRSSPIGSFIDTFTGRTSSLEQQNKQIEKDSIKANQDFIAGQGARFAAATKEQVVASVAAGGNTTFDDFLNSLDPSIRAVIENTDKVNGNTDEMDKLRKNFENQKKAIIENIKFIKAMNFGFSEVTSGITAYSSSLNNLTAAQETGFSTAAFAAETLGTAISSAGKLVSSAELGQSLNALEDNLKKFGANAEQITDARALITGLNDLQKSAADALLAVKAGFKGGSTSPEVIKNQLRDAILGSIPDSSPIKQKLLDSFGKLEIPPEAIQEFLNTGDVSVILDKAFGPIQEQVQKQLLGPLQEMAKQEKILVGLTQQRRKAEQQLISVQKKAIDTQIEAAKAFEEFGGAKFTPEKEFAARRQQANLVLRDAGLGGLTTGSAADIRAVGDQLVSRFSAQQQLQDAAAAGGGGAFGGVEGVDKDRREELKASNEALITFTKQSIEARKKELELINKKNEAEKQSLQSLLSGDIESFFDQAIGAAAGSALRSGNAQVAGLFGAGALGQGLQNIQGTVSDSENKRAASIAFGAFGLGDNAARVFTGNTREQEKIKSEGRELALLQGELANQSAEMEQMTVDAKEVVISAANVRLTEIGQQVSSAQSALNFNSRGGVVYANRGMFIPRGTDTVPAMLTPGEFVVNRAAVQRGNNLQILRSMNSNSAPIQATQALSSGGPVRYRANGSTGPEGPGGIDFSKFEEMVNKFQEVTDKLGNVNIKHMFEKLGTLDINHMFNGNMQQAFKDEILAEAGNMMSRSKFNSDGSITTSDRSVLG